MGKGKSANCGRGACALLGAQAGMAKGQILSTEIVVSFAIFLAAILIFMIGLSNMFYTYSESRSDLGMQVALLGIADASVLSPGSPSDWESSGSTVAHYGFAESANVLSARKLSAAQGLFSSNYSEAKTRFGAGRFDIGFTVVDQGGSVLYGFGRAANFTNGTSASASAERLALLDGQLVRLKVTLWRQKGGAV